MDYASWASQADGPGIYKFPAPANTYQSDPNYQVCGMSRRIRVHQHRADHSNRPLTAFSSPATS